MSKVVQVRLSKLSKGNRNSILVCWVDLLPGVKGGSTITFKDGPEGRWLITALGDTQDKEGFNNIGRRYREINGGLE